MQTKSEATLAVLRVIADTPAIKGGAIRARLREHDRDQISRAIYALTYHQEIVRDESGRYSIAAKGRASLSDTGTGPAAPAPTKNAPAPARKTPNLTVVVSTLRKLAEESQNALDTYLQSVGDPAIYEPLKRARDEADAALAAYTGESSARARATGEG